MHAFLESVVFAALVLAPLFASLGPRPLLAKDLPADINPPQPSLPKGFVLLNSRACAE